MHCVCKKLNWNLKQYLNYTEQPVTSRRSLFALHSRDPQSSHSLISFEILILEIICPHCVDMHVRLPLLCRSLECKAYRDLGELTGCSVQFRCCLRLKTKFVYLLILVDCKVHNKLSFLNRIQTKIEWVNQRSVSSTLGIWFSNTKSVWLGT